MKLISIFWILILSYSYAEECINLDIYVVDAKNRPLANADLLFIYENADSIIRETDENGEFYELFSCGSAYPIELHISKKGYQTKSFDLTPERANDKGYEWIGNSPIITLKRAKRKYLKRNE